MTVAKGITNGSIPMAGVFVNRGIHDAIMQGPEHIIELFHGYTYSGHPVACAAGMATLDIYDREGLLERAAALSPLWEDAVHSLRDSPHVIDIRNIGLVAGIELEPRGDGVGKRAYDVFLDCFENGVLVRQSGDILALFSAPHRRGIAYPSDRRSNLRSSPPREMISPVQSWHCPSFKLFFLRSRLTFRYAIQVGYGGCLSGSLAPRAACPYRPSCARNGCISRIGAHAQHYEHVREAAQRGSLRP